MDGHAAEGLDEQFADRLANLGVRGDPPAATQQVLGVLLRAHEPHGGVQCQRERALVGDGLEHLAPIAAGGVHDHLAVADGAGDLGSDLW